MIANKYRLAAAKGMFERPQGEDSLEPKRIMFLSTEGFLTERCYFRNLDCFLRQNKSQVQIHVLCHHNDGLSSPRQVLDLLSECKEIHEKGILPFDAIGEIQKHFDDLEIARILDNDRTIPKDRLKLFKSMLLKLGIDYDYRCFLKNRDERSDSFAVVLDRDCKSHEAEEMEYVWSKCREHGFGFFITNPCFEFWLFLHLWDGTPLSEDEKNKMLENPKVSNQHTYMSRLLGEMAHHTKRIGKEDFGKYYYGNIHRAIENSYSFATDIALIFNELGTNLGELINDCIGIQESSES